MGVSYFNTDRFEQRSNKAGIYLRNNLVELHSYRIFKDRGIVATAPCHCLIQRTYLLIYLIYLLLKLQIHNFRPELLF